MKQITLTIDGSCPLNPGTGGWACTTRSDEHFTEQAGGCAQTTNNRAEMQAAIEGLKTLEEPHEVLLVSDSKHLLNGVTGGLHKWRANGWMVTRHRRTYPLANLDLWQELDELAEKHSIRGQWVKSHSVHPDHERCEELASAQAASPPTPLAGLA